MYHVRIAYPTGPAPKAEVSAHEALELMRLIVDEPMVVQVVTGNGAPVSQFELQQTDAP